MAFSAAYKVVPIVFARPGENNWSNIHGNVCAAGLYSVDRKPAPVQREALGQQVVARRRAGDLAAEPAQQRRVVQRERRPGREEGVDVGGDATGGLPALYQLGQ